LGHNYSALSMPRCTRIVVVMALALVCAGNAAAQRKGELARATVINQQVLQLYRQSRYADAIPLAREALALKERALGHDHLLVSIYVSNLAELYRREGDYANAEQLFKRSLEIREKALPPDDRYVAYSVNDLAVLYYDQGRYSEAEPLFKRRLAISEKALGLDASEVGTGLNNLAALYIDQGRYAEAEALLERSQAISEKAFRSGDPQVAIDLNNLASLYSRQQKYAKAERLYERSLTIRKKAFGPDHLEVATGLNNLAVMYRDQGLYAKAEPLSKRSLAIIKKTFGPDHIQVANSLNNLASVYSGQRRYAKAEPLFKRSLAIIEKVLGPDHPDLANSRANLAALYYNWGRYAEGLSFSQQAIKILGKRLGNETSAQSGNAERRSMRVYFLNHIRLLDAVRQPTAAAESFRVSQFANTSAAAQAVTAMATRFAAGTDALAAVVRERQDLAQRLRGLDAAILEAVSKPPERRDARAEAALREELSATKTKVDALDVRIGHQFPQYAEYSNPKPLEMEAAQALLAPDEALLVYLVGSDETWVWALRRDRIAFYRIDIGAKDLDAQVNALRERLDPQTLGPFPVARAHALYRRILAPAEPQLDGAHRIIIVPDAALESLPFEVLVTQPPKADPQNLADHRNVAWFARDNAITVLPSVVSIRALREFGSAAHASAPFVGIGNPVLVGKLDSNHRISLSTLFHGSLADVDLVRALQPLPATGELLRAVAKALGGTEQDLYLADRASEPLLRQAGLERYRVVEFATHGLISREMPGLTEPALVLTPPTTPTPENDGLLTASKIATLKLNADWVVLSGCNTAASDGTPDAGGLSGLAKAFFYAGARSLLVSHWSVQLEPTAKLVTDAVEHLVEEPSIGRAEALRRAEMQMLDPKNPPEYAHPANWAPFVLVGEGGAGH
jgi:CHAT domain-containing protein